ncbi:hypothetical protein HY031_02885 [Candidatus Gottesmanbacteria bacterium]|nr:hypothetical protein [Candidatus Gottesmanbacteria bacterium]
MKKLAFIVGLFFLIPTIAPPANADCFRPPTINICPAFGNTIRCQASGQPLECCSTQNDCNAYLSSIAAQRAAAAGEKMQKLCDSIPEGQRGACQSCFDAGNAWTAIGCIPSTPSGFIRKFLDLGIGIAGGIAFLLILFGGLQILTSAGNPERLNAGKELLTSAISGLILIALSLFLLRLIGFNILQIPGFG